jgi:hypothetical protein
MLTAVRVAGEHVFADQSGDQIEENRDLAGGTKPNESGPLHPTDTRFERLWSRRSRVRAPSLTPCEVPANPVVLVRGLGGWLELGVPRGYRTCAMRRRRHRASPSAPFPERMATSPAASRRVADEVLLAESKDSVAEIQELASEHADTLPGSVEARVVILDTLAPRMTSSSAGPRGAAVLAQRRTQGRDQLARTDRRS